MPTLLAQQDSLFAGEEATQTTLAHNWQHLLNEFKAETETENESTSKRCEGTVLQQVEFAFGRLLPEA